MDPPTHTPQSSSISWLKDMCSMWARFEAAPPVGWVTVWERNSQFVAHDSSDGDEGDGSNSYCSHYPSHQHSHRQQGVVYGEVKVSDGESRRDRGKGDNFLPYAEDSYLKRAWDAWKKDGLVAALQCFEGQHSPAGVSSTVTGFLLSLSQHVGRIYGKVSPQSLLSVEEVIHCYSSHSDWSSCVVRALALHPRLHFLALARQNDEVDVRALTGTEHQVVLRDKQQVGVACMQWAPHCDSLLAVGTATGLLLWHVDAASPATKFVSTWVRYESSPGHTPITSLSWSPWGNFIVSACPRDGSVLIWDVPLGVGTRVRRGKTGGVASVAWSPDGHRVFAGGVAPVFHVWGTEKWTSERWAKLKGRCKSGCWSSGGEMLLFALEKDPSLYYISFHGSEASSFSTAIKCADLSMYSTSEDGAMVGGEVQSMVWDPSSQRLALTFTKSSPSAELVAIFRTRRSELLEVLPGGFVRGLPEEYPSLVAFKPGFSAGALLTVCWSSGRISFIPLYFHNPASSPVPGTALGSSLPEVVPGYAAPTPPPPLSLLTGNESLLRPSLNRTFDSNQGTPLYSIH